MTFEEIKELMTLLDQSSLTGIEIQDETHKVKLKKEVAVYQPQQYASPAQPLPPALHNEVKVEESLVEVTGRTINAPMVGTFYKSPSPESDAYVKVGDTVSSESIVCILEAMKLFNEIQADISGEITEILVEDGQMVEYGQPLFRVK